MWTNPPRAEASKCTKLPSERSHLVLSYYIHCYDTFSLLSLFGSSQVLPTLCAHAARKSGSLWTRRQAVVTGVFPSPSRCISWISLRIGFSVPTVRLFSLNPAHSRSSSLNDRRRFHGVQSRGALPARVTGVCRLDYGTNVIQCFTYTTYSMLFFSWNDKRDIARAHGYGTPRTCQSQAEQ